MRKAILPAALIVAAAMVVVILFTGAMTNPNGRWTLVTPAESADGPFGAMSEAARAGQAVSLVLKDGQAEAALGGVNLAFTYDWDGQGLTVGGVWHRCERAREWLSIDTPDGTLLFRRGE